MSSPLPARCLLRPKDTVVVSLSGQVSPRVLFRLPDALAAVGVNGYVVQGIPPPRGERLTSPFVEARNNLERAALVVVVASVNDIGQLSDDWTFHLHAGPTSRGCALLYTVRGLVGGADFVSPPNWPYIVEVRADDDALVARICEDIVKLLAAPPATD